MTDKKNMQKINQVLIYGDGLHDDTEALQKILNGEAQGIYLNGEIFEGLGRDRKTFLISKTLEIN